MLGQLNNTHRQNVFTSGEAAVIKLKEKRHNDDTGDYKLTLPKNISFTSNLRVENAKENCDPIDAFCAISVETISAKGSAKSDFSADNKEVEECAWHSNPKDSLLRPLLSSSDESLAVLRDITTAKSVSLSSPSFHDFPETVKFLIINSAWKLADCATEQYFLRCSCAFARDCCSTFISSLHLHLSGALDAGYAGALQQLTWFPLHSNLTHLILTRNDIHGISPNQMSSEGKDNKMMPEVSICEQWFKNVWGYRLRDVEKLTFINMDLTEQALEEAVTKCPRLRHLNVTGGRCFGPVLKSFGSYPVCGNGYAAISPLTANRLLLSLDLTACAGRERYLFESLAQLTCLTRLNLTLSKVDAVLLKEVAPFVSRLLLLQKLRISGTDMFKLDLSGAAPLVQLQHLSDLELTQHNLPLATYRTIARGVRGTVALQARTLAGITALTLLSLPDNTLVGEDASLIISLPLLKDLVVYGLFNSSLNFHAASSAALRALAVTCEMPIDTNRVAALVQITRLTSLSFKSSITRDALNLILGMPSLQFLAAKQLLLHQATHPVSELPPPTLTLEGASKCKSLSAAAATTSRLEEVRLITCDDPAQLLLIPGSVTSLGLINVHWEMPLRDTVCGNQSKDSAMKTPAGLPTQRKLFVDKCSPLHTKLQHGDGRGSSSESDASGDLCVMTTAAEELYLSTLRSAATVLKHLWKSSLSQGERCINLCCTPGMLKHKLVAMQPLLNGAHCSKSFKVITVTDAAVDADMVHRLAAAAPLLSQLTLSRCHLVSGACPLLGLLFGSTLQTLTLLWTSFQYDQLADLFIHQHALSHMGGLPGMRIYMAHGLYEQDVKDKLMQVLHKKDYGHLSKWLMSHSSRNQGNGDKDVELDNKHVKLVWHPLVA
ncbi:hypothetical protein CEUSTIGMA_g5724.t1 [Chlamydomonas eustigma]|uniref:Uncharacterized protein n=1 Tax=Chlamydomonas eustigma TaxID=1157962 RepID=A0A250X5W2_9CHLO|nr:hypothetical protein CEUSTIGMA_g5724.t1 [Chlamydomonas eustigma]|eukprot:GAX78282.1 hypothetical protein CEUSTIGMA_g5724.t1 [Chlamydomonas eustigma]